MTHPENGNKAGDATQKQPNRLIHESSPYLQQHAWNPVDWYPWGNEALDRARQENRLIFLSIGYSSCHWCHVMERECFEDPAIARLLNKHFVNIKVDREERPDVDAVYMEALQMMTGHGGWPLNVWLTPDQIPIFAGTYFPPQDLHGRPGLPTVVSRLVEVYRKQPDKVRNQAEEMQQALDKDLYDHLSHENITSDLLDQAFRAYRDAYDRENGGFSAAPKFPMAMGIGFLLRYSAFPGSDQAKDMALTSLEKMITGGIYDQIGGGFHRYSTDDQWLVPHFEKMLYDNALLLPVLAEAAWTSGRPVFSETVKETLDFLNREMRHPDGAYYSALDADTEGVEGKFYTFTFEELKQVLDKNTLSLFSRHYGVTPEGNWEGVSVLHRATEPEEPAKEDNTDIETVRNRLKKAKKDLLDYRNRRTRPGLDDKIITSWNALMLIGLCRCSRILGHGTGEAVRLGTFLQERIIDNDTVYRIVDRDDNVKQPGFLDDYALLIDGFSRLFEITGQPHWLSLAARLTGILIDRFYDPDKNAFHYTSRNEQPLIADTRDIFDNAQPSGSSAAISALYRMGHLTGNPEWTRIAVDTAGPLAGVASTHAPAFGYLLQVMHQHCYPGNEIIIASKSSTPTNPDSVTKQMVDIWREKFDPTSYLVVLPASENQQKTIFEHNSLSDSVFSSLYGDKTPRNGKTTAYICRDFQCRSPVQSPEAFRKAIVSDNTSG